ncbi:MAG: hypothetical protein H6Q49_513, partial [Deltaproteobacteria bacterium]|nr:hypothetical protein [Deltaproteobacteria bacterium]
MKIIRFASSEEEVFCGAYSP